MNNASGTTGNLAWFSAITKATNDKAIAQNMLMIIGEFHGNPWPPRLRATTKKERVDINIIEIKFGKRSTKAINACAGGGSRRSALSRNDCDWWRWYNYRSITQGFDKDGKYDALTSPNGGVGLGAGQKSDGDKSRCRLCVPCTLFISPVLRSPLTKGPIAFAIENTTLITLRYGPRCRSFVNSTKIEFRQKTGQIGLWSSTRKATPHQPPAGWDF